MKKVLSILIASALAAMPLSTGVFAEERDSSCGIANALETVISIYKNTGANAGGSDSGCGIMSILEKLAEIKGGDIGCLITGSCENSGGDECSGSDGSCGSAGTETTCPDGSCDENGGDCTDGTCENDTAVDQNIFDDLINIWQESVGDQSGAGEETESDTPEVQLPASSEAAQVIELVNSYRAQYGLSALEYDASLAQAAQIRAEEQQTVFSHTRPDGTSCFTALDECGVSYRGAGENIAMGQTSAEEVMNDWMNSEGHRENILNESFTKIGVGLYKGENGRYYWAQMFIY